MVDVEINVKDESYPWFLHWMTAHQRSQLRRSPSRNIGNDDGDSRTSVTQKLLRRLTPRIHHLSIKTDTEKRPSGSVQAAFALLPGPGKHVIRYKDTFLMVDRVRETKSISLERGLPWETITITTLYSQRHLLEDLFREAYHLAQRSTEGKTVVYTSRSMDWAPFGEPRRKRPLESVILDKGVKERILGDVRDFLASEVWYHNRGIPYRRGYLLHGTPGSGKSSFVQALAAELDYNIAVLNLSERGLTDDRLNHLLSVVPRCTLVLLEDADSAFSNRRVQTDNDGYRGANVTFSGLLNALDGVSSAEERLLFLTTNHVESLDAALVRPGRVDMTVEIGNASRWQAENLWDRFYGYMDEHGCGKTRFLRRLQELCLIPDVDENHLVGASGTSMAALQGLFLYNKDDTEGAISMAQELVPLPPIDKTDTSPLGMRTSTSS